MAARVKRGKEKWHGTIAGYVNHKCRCTKCKTAWSEYHAQYRQKRFKNGRKKCLVKDCTNKAWPSAGNGLCQEHHERKIKLRKRVEARKRAERRKRRAAA